MLSSQEKQTALSDKVYSLKTLLNVLLGASTFSKLQQQVEDNDKDENNSSYIDLTSYANALINQPILGYKVMIDDQKHVFGRDGDNNPSSGKSILDGIDHMYMSRPPAYLVSGRK